MILLILFSFNSYQFNSKPSQSEQLDDVSALGSYPFGVASLQADNITSNSIQVIKGNLIYSDLIQNPEFLSSEGWTFTNSTNITSEWAASSQDAWVHYQSLPHYTIQNTAHLADSANLILYWATSNSLSSTHVRDGQYYGIQEGGSANPYNINIEFAFNTALSNITSLEVNFYGYASSGDSMYWQIYNYRDTQWENLFYTSYSTLQWYNSTTLVQDPLDPTHIDPSGDLTLRIYDDDPSDGTRTWVYWDYLEIKINGTGLATNEFDQVASISQIFNKNFETFSIPSPIDIVLWEGFESGDFVTNGWTAYQGDGILEVYSSTPYNGTYCAHFAGDSTTDPSLLSKTLNLSGSFDASLSFYVNVVGVEDGEYLAVDIYDGTWHTDVRQYDGNIAYTQETIDLASFNHIDGFQIRFRGYLNHPTGDTVRLDDIIVTTVRPTGSPSVLLNFSYSVDQLENIEALDLQITLWNSTGSLGALWNVPIAGTTSKINVSVEISNLVAPAGIYNISFEAHAILSTTQEANLSVHYDTIQIICYQIKEPSTFSYFLHNQDNQTLHFSPSSDGLEIVFNFTAQEGNLTFHANYNTPAMLTVWIYNFTSMSWDNLTPIQTSSFEWINVSNIMNFDYVVDLTRTLSIKYTNSSSGLDDPFLLDYHSLSIYTYSANLTHLQTYPVIVQAGETTKVQVNYSSRALVMPIEDANIQTSYSEDQYIVQDLGEGLYNITFYTDLATPGQKIVEITAFKEGFENSSIITSFNLTGFPLDARFSSGVSMVNGNYWLGSSPFPDDQSKQVQIYINGSFGAIDGAIIQARLNLTGQLLPFIDIGNTIGHAYDGYYNITVDTSDLQDGDVGRVDISAIVEGYVSPRLNFTFQVSTITSDYLTLDTDIENISVIEGNTIRIGASFIDLFHDTVLFRQVQDGFLTWRINAPGADDLHIMDKLLTVYVSDIPLSLYNVTPGVYNLTIETWASQNYENITKNIRLEVLPKIDAQITLIAVPTYVLAGDFVTISANLTLASGAPIINTPITFRMVYEYRAVSGIYEETHLRLTNSAGIGELSLTMQPIYKSFQVSVDYSGNNTVTNTSVSSNQNPILVLNSSIVVQPIPSEIMEGSTIMIAATLYVNNTVASNRTLTFMFIVDGVFEGDQRTAATGSNGTATISYNIPRGISTLEVLVSYEGKSYENLNSSSISTTVVSITTFIWRYSYIWGPIIGIILLVTVGLYVNKRLLHLTKFQKSINRLKEQISKREKNLGADQPSRETMFGQLLETKLVGIKKEKIIRDKGK